MKLLAGLGNPGAAYGLTRHNIGFMAVDRIAADAGCTLERQNLEALIGRGRLSGRDILLAKPLTFMNRSGAAVRAIAEAYALQGEDIIILHDDMDLPFSTIRIKTSGGAGGHRGIASISQCLQTDAFVRLRIGIGRPPETVPGAEYVLEQFSDAELQKIAAINDLVADCLKMILSSGIPAAMNRFHTRPMPAEKSGRQSIGD